MTDIAHGRILVRGVNWLGDAVMTTPALLRLREAYPAAHVTLLTAEKLQELWRTHPAVDDVITFKARESVISVAWRLRARQFTHALVLPNSPRSALESFLAGIPFRLGYARPWRNRLLTHTLPARKGGVTMHKRTAREIRLLTAPAGPATLPHEPWPRPAWSLSLLPLPADAHADSCESHHTNPRRCPVTPSNTPTLDQDRSRVPFNALILPGTFGPPINLPTNRPHPRGLIQVYLSLLRVYGEICL